jgi:multidrug transporter EmrE-like cation transporter
MPETTLVTSALVLIGILGAYLSRQVRADELHWSAMYITTFLSSSVWIYLTRVSSLSLVWASCLYDVVYCLAFFLGFLLLGERVSWIQAVGVVLLLAGMSLVSIGE